MVWHHYLVMLAPVLLRRSLPIAPANLTLTCLVQHTAQNSSEDSSSVSHQMHHYIISSCTQFPSPSQRPMRTQMCMRYCLCKAVHCHTKLARRTSGSECAHNLLEEHHTFARDGARVEFLVSYHGFC